MIGKNKLNIDKMMWACFSSFQILIKFVYKKKSKFIQLNHIYFNIFKYRLKIIKNKMLRNIIPCQEIHFKTYNFKISNLYSHCNTTE